MGEVEQLVNLGAWGYAFAAVAYLLLALLLITSWRGRMQGGLLLAVAVSSAVWSAWVAISQFLGLDVSVIHIWLELLRDGCVLLFLFKLATTVPQVMQGRWQPLKLFAYFTMSLWLLLSDSEPVPVCVPTVRLGISASSPAESQTGSRRHQ